MGWALRTSGWRGRSSTAEGREVSDDATAVEAVGVPVLVVDGSPDALKITGPADLPVAENILRGRE